MFTGAEMTRTNMDDEEKDRLVAALHAFSDEARTACLGVGLGAGRSPFGRPSNFIVVINAGGIHLVVDDVIVGGMPDHAYFDKRSELNSMSLQAVVGASVQEFGFRDPIGVTLPLSVLQLNEAERRMALLPAAREVAAFMRQKITVQELKLPFGYEHYARFMPAFLQDHPEPERNIFLMMRFTPGSQYEAITKTLRTIFTRYGLSVLRADDKDYTGDLWENVCTYMLGVRYGIAVFEEIDVREFNPNIALELGFMLALSRRCLILKDRRMPRVPTDIVGKLYKEFDTYNIEDTIAAAVTSWVRDVGIPPAG